MKNELLTRAYIVAGVLTLLGLLVFGQTFRIAVQEGDRWRAKGDSLHISYVPVEAPRGNLLAADGSLLATSLPFFEIRMDTRAAGLTNEVFDEEIDSLAHNIHTYVNPALSVDSTKLRLSDARARGDRYLLIHKQAGYPLYERMRSWPIFRRGQHRGGFIALRSEQRRRPFGMLAQRTIGYSRGDGTAVGLEGRFNDRLSGEEGSRPMMRLPGNHLLPIEDLDHANPRSGDDVQTTLDVTIQDIAQQELTDALERHEAEYGVALVMETRTGAIRAMSNLTRSKSGRISEVFNHAVGTPVEPGSTFKLASMLAMLDDGKVDLEDTIRLFKGSRRFYERTLIDASAHGIDSSTARRAFEISSNVGIAGLVERAYANNQAGRLAFVNKLRQFRLDRMTGIEVLGEKFPRIKDPTQDTLNKWSGITLPWMSMGYELELTPLQLTSFYNAVANDGRYMKPRLVKNVQREGRILQEFPPMAFDNAIASKHAIEQAQALLEGVVERGTAKKFRSELYTFAGKTGTVQYNYSPEAKERGESGHQASFIGYFPAESPRYTMMVLISKPQKGGIYGSDVALPIWRNMADKLYAADPNLRKPVYARSQPRWNEDVLPKHGKGSYEDIHAVLASLRVPAFDRARRGMAELTNPGDTLTVASLEISPGYLPDVRGMGARDAMYLLENLGCRVDIRGRGLITRQSIAPGTKANGQYVKLTLG